ncbi:MAG TPA: hypothetical protein VFM18_23920 [Methanosarcina sp.]|nr:hypothetical protein [Methanosarcina sp.]
MSRTFANFIYLGNLYSQNPSTSPAIKGMYELIFKPLVSIIEEDCGTKLGDNLAVGSQIRGFIELSNGDAPITPTRINFLVQHKVPSVYVRNVASCASDGGVCRKCLYGSYQYLDPSFNRLLVTVPGDYPALSTVPAVGATVRLDFTGDTSKFLSYMANGYSGAVLGMKSYLHEKLPLREGLYLKSLTEQKVAMFIREIMDENIVGTLEIEYGTKIGDNIEKVLFLLAQYFIAYYVNTQS